MYDVLSTASKDLNIYWTCLSQDNTPSSIQSYQIHDNHCQRPTKRSSVTNRQNYVNYSSKSFNECQAKVLPVPVNITVNNFNFENSRHASDIQLNIDSNGSRKSSNNCIKQVIRKRWERCFQNYLRIHLQRCKSLYYYVYT